MDNWSGATWQGVLPKPGMHLVLLGPWTQIPRISPQGVFPEREGFRSRRMLPAVNFVLEEERVSFTAEVGQRGPSDCFSEQDRPERGHC